MIFIQRSISAGILILFIMGIRAAAVHKLPKKFFVALWGIVLLRLLLPFDMPITYGLATPVNRFVTERTGQLQQSFQMQKSQAEPEQTEDIKEQNAEAQTSEGQIQASEAQTSGNQTSGGQTQTAEVQTAEVQTTEARDTEAQTAGAQVQDAEVQTTAAQTTENQAAVGIADVLTWIWAGGMLILLLVFGRLYLREYRKLREALPLPQEEEGMIRRLFIPYKGKVRLLVSDRVSTPLTCGIWPARIIFPKNFRTADDMQLKYVVTHEMIHIKRMDNIWKILMILAVIIHWFNPLVWVMYIMLSRDMELSCDERVIHLLGEENKKNYAIALVSLAEKSSQRSFLYNGFGRNSIQERIAAIMKYKKTTVLSIGCAAAMLLAATTVFAAPEVYVGEGTYAEDSSYADESLSSYMVGSNTSKSSTAVPAGKESFLDTESFLEYKEFGLFYDEENGHLMYDNQIVGYFKDEMVKNTYRRFIDPAGTLGIVVNRDADNRITGLEQVEVPQVTGVTVGKAAENSAVESYTLTEDVEGSTPGTASTNSSTVESYALTEDVEGSTPGAASTNSSAVESYTLTEDVEGSTPGAASTNSSAVESYALTEDVENAVPEIIIEESKVPETTVTEEAVTTDEEMAGNAVLSDAAPAEESTYIEATAVADSAYSVDNGDSSSTLSAYTDYGLAYTEKDQRWRYGDKEVAALYDPNVSIFTQGDIPEDKAVYLEVIRDKNGEILYLKSISKSEMQTLVEHS